MREAIAGYAIGAIFGFDVNGLKWKKAKVTVTAGGK